MPGGERRHQVLDVVRAAQFGIGQTQNDLVLINNRSLREPEIGLIGVGAEGDLARPNVRQTFRRVDHRDIFRRLIFKNAQLGRAIIRDGAITIEMIGSEVEPETYRWPESLDRLQLERTHFYREHIELLFFPRHFRERLTNVSAGNCPLAARVQHLREQFRRGGLAVRSGNCDDRTFQK